MKENPYKVLYVDPVAPQAVIKASYRALIKDPENHPDLGGDANKAKVLNDAYSTLSDTSKRAELDRTLEHEEVKNEHRFFVVCQNCYAVNEVPAPEMVFKTQCTKCRRPFILNGEGRYAKSPPHNRAKPRGGKPSKQNKTPPSEELAVYLYEKKLYTRALEDFIELSKIHPRNVHYSYMAGMCHYRIHHYSDAKYFFLKSLKIEPNHYLSALYMGKTLMKINKFAAAIDYFLKATLLRKDFLKPRALMGACYFKLAMYEKAIAVLNDVVGKDPTLDQAIYFLSMSYYKKREFLKARSCFQICRQLYPENEKIPEMLQHCERHLNTA